MSGGFLSNAFSLQRERLLRALIDAHSAIDAKVGVDNTNVLKRKCVLRALVYTDAARNAFISVYGYCHDHSPFSSLYSKWEDPHLPFTYDIK